MPGALQRLLFPQTFREVPHRRLILNVFRSLHILCFSVFLGGFFFNQPATVLNGWYAGAILSGLILFSIDLYSSFIMLFELRGMSVLIKILVLLMLPLLDYQGQLWVIMLVVVFSSFVSHSSRKLRHKNLLPLAWQASLDISSPVHSKRSIK